MKKKEKRFLVILILVSIIIIGVVYVITRKPEEKANNEPNTVNNNQNQVEGAKTVTSDKLNKPKEINGIEVTDISITENNGLAEVRANVTNSTNSEKPEFTVTIKMLDKNGNVLQELGALVGKTKPGETRQILASIDMDISQVEDIKIEK